MCDFNDLDGLDPSLLEIDEFIREVHDFQIKTRQFLESTGLITITEPKGLILTNAYVSGLTVVKDITSILLLVNTQGSCPQDTLIIDTGKLNEYTSGDIEPGIRKLVEVHYVTNDVTYEEKKVSKKQFIQENKIRSFDADDECSTLPKFIVDGESQIYKINADRFCPKTE